MKTRLASAATIVVASLLLAGCAASKEDAVLSACKAAAEERVGASVDLSGAEAANMGDALYEAAVTDERDTDDADALFMVTGDVTYSKGGKEVRLSMLCSVNYEGGEPGEPDLTLS